MFILLYLHCKLRKSLHVHTASKYCQSTHCRYDQYYYQNYNCNAEIRSRKILQVYILCSAQCKNNQKDKSYYRNHKQNLISKISPHGNRLKFVRQIFFCYSLIINNLLWRCCICLLTIQILLSICSSILLSICTCILLSICILILLSIHITLPI